MAADNRPNILLLHADQQRFDTIAALGASHVHSPALDRLARAGRSFLRAYSSNPVCMPARHDLLTGAGPRHHGYYGNSGAFLRDHALATLPRLLTQAGYQTIGIGKMHHNPPREHHGWAHLHLMEELPDSREDDAYLQYLEQVGFGHVRCQHGVRPLFYHTPQPSRVPEEHHGSAWVARKTIEVIETPRDRPWFIMASWVGPHPPYYVPQPYLDMYRDTPLPEPCPPPPGGGGQVPPSPENPGAHEPRGIRMREAYFAAVTLIDTHIGRILDALDRNGLSENTVVVFTSDHGEMLGDRNAYQKQVPYEGAAHIPLLIQGPGFEPNTRTLRPVTTWDVAATILDAAGVRPAETHPLVGDSLRAESQWPADRIVTTQSGSGAGRYLMAIGGGHKFIHWYNGGQEALYDLENDPWEQNDLLGGGGSPPADLVEPLRLACMEFERTHGAPDRIADRDFRDFPYHEKDPYAYSLYPRWSSFQYPHWMKGYAADDLAAIEAEMKDCIASEVACICTDPDWRAHAVDEWRKIGGDPAVLEPGFPRV